MSGTSAISTTPGASTASPATSGRPRAPVYLGITRGPSRADLNADGLLDLADLNAFGSAFLADDPRSDLAMPVGVFDLEDI